MFQSITPESLELIRQGQQFDPSYDDGLSNHLPMALAALAFCGARPQQLAYFYQRYTPRLEPIRTTTTNPTDKQPEVGNKQHFARFVHFYRQKINQIGIEKTVRETLPKLLPGIITAAFHAVIRLSYAVQIQDDEEAAIALAYWSSEYQALGELVITNQYEREEQIKAAFDTFSGYQYQPGNIVDRANELIHTPLYRKIAAIPADINAEQVARTTIRQYLASDNFTLLHGVTGFQALQVLLPYCEGSTLALRYFWQAYIAALCVSRTPVLFSELAEAPLPQWERWTHQVLDYDDDHTIKLVYSCAYLYQHFPLPEYSAAVAIRLAKEV